MTGRRADSMSASQKSSALNDRSVVVYVSATVFAKRKRGTNESARRPVSQHSTFYSSNDNTSHLSYSPASSTSFPSFSRFNS